MASCTISSTLYNYLVLTALIFCNAGLSLSYTFTTYDSLIKLQHSITNHVSFSSIKIEAIYQFGDSISDTGNFILESPLSHYAKFPYGKTFFHKPTGRCSNGLLIIDYITKFFNLPFLDPYLNKHGNFTHGINFAVAGATALNISTLVEKDIANYPTNSSLLVQLDWFKSYLNSNFPRALDRKKKLAKALVMMGEIGGNDFNFAFFSKKPIATIYKMVPEVVQTIKDVLKEVINLGAINIVVPGNFPIGCMTVYLNMFKTNDSKMYDELRCLSYLNDLAKFYNDKLQDVIEQLQKDYSSVTIIYADYFFTFRDILQHANSYGFDKGTMQKACCSICAGSGNSICDNPDKYINWDTVHLTQHSYQIMAKSLMKNMSSDSSYAVRFQMTYKPVVVMMAVFLFLVLENFSNPINGGFWW